MALSLEALPAPPPTFVFAGTVVATRATTLRAVPASERTMAVRVDEAFAAPPPLAHFRGREVTVLLAAGSKAMHPGERAVFFTAGWLLGDGAAAVVETEPSERCGRARALERLAASLRRWEDEGLRRRMAAADMVAIGRVTAVRSLAQAGWPAPHGEHQPEWREAIVQVREALEDKAAGRLVAVRFPASRDVAFLRAPRIEVGQEWIWMLAADRATGAPAPSVGGSTAATFVVLDVLDVQPMDRLGRVRALLASPRRNPRQR